MHPELIRALSDDRRAQIRREQQQHWNHRPRSRAPTGAGAVSASGSRLRNRVGQVLVAAGSRIMTNEVGTRQSVSPG